MATGGSTGINWASVARKANAALAPKKPQGNLITRSAKAVYNQCSTTRVALATLTVGVITFSLACKSGYFTETAIQEVCNTVAPMALNGVVKVAQAAGTVAGTLYSSAAGTANFFSKLVLLVN